MSRCVCFNQIDLQAQKGFLHAQLDNSLTMTSTLEAEITGLRSELRDRDEENADLRSRLTRLEVSAELGWVKCNVPSLYRRGREVKSEN